MSAQERHGGYRETMSAHVHSSLDDDHPARPHSSAREAAAPYDPLTFVPDSAHLLARGRNADVYLINDTQVLRRLHTGATNYPNVDLLRHLNAHGYPTARLIAVEGTDLVMERLHGPTLLQALDTEVVTIPEGVRILLDLHNALHALPLPPGTEASAGECILHLDLHPGNVLLTSTGPQVIDWEAARFGPAELDLATTALIFAEVVVDGNEYAHAAHSMLRHFNDATGPGYGAQVAEAADLRAAHPTLDPAERELLPEARNVVARELERITG